MTSYNLFILYYRISNLFIRKVVVIVFLVTIVRAIASVGYFKELLVVDDF